MYSVFMVCIENNEFTKSCHTSFDDGCHLPALRWQAADGRGERMMQRLLIGREITWGGQIPRGWNLAWYEPRRRVAVYFPMPLHWLARVARDLLWRVQLAWNAEPQERHERGEMQRVTRERQLLAEEYARGYLDGWEECFDAWTRAMNCDPHLWTGREN
jgi:hypothetical protein